MARNLPSLTPTATNPFGRAPRRRPKKDGRQAAREWLAARLAVLDAGRIALAVVTTLLLSALLSLHLLPDKVSLRAGEVSGEEVRAARTVQYTDWDATRRLREENASRVDPIYLPVRYASAEADQTIGDVYAHLRRARLLGNLRPARAGQELKQEVGVSLADPAVLAPLLHAAAGPRHLEQAERITHQVVRDAMSHEIRDDYPDDLAQARGALAARIAASPLPREDVPAVAALARAIVRPNRHLDERGTQKARDGERSLVAPQTGQVFAGEIVVRKGDTVTSGTIDKLRALGLQNPRLDPVVVLCVTLLVALMVGLVVAYLAQYQKTVYASAKTLALLSALALLSVLGLKLGGAMLNVRLGQVQFGYVGLICVTASAMLMAALAHPRVALVITALLAAQSGLILGNDFRFSLMTLLSGMVGIYGVSDIRSRGDVVRAGLALCAANVFLSLVIGRIEGDLAADLEQSVTWAFFSGLLSAALFSVGAALFERLFGITTHLRLLELSDPNRPLMQRFCQLAPGTYTHSIMVGNLAVVAAEAIGADALLCRVGALYHDLGKMKRAEFFIENQGGGDNVHERLNPSLSALVVTAHVKDGLEMAEQEKLPPVIKSFIEEHHGTSLIKYFFHQQTTQGDGDAPGLEQHFRYGGPKPQSRETAILMLADGVEAASRTLDKPTAGRIADLVDKIIGAQLSDGQLDECDLTLRDLRGIRDAFVHLLSGMLHSRIEYPELLKDPKAETHGTADLPSHAAVALPAVRAGGAGSADGGASDSAAA